MNDMLIIIMLIIKVCNVVLNLIVSKLVNTKQNV